MSGWYLFTHRTRGLGFAFLILIFNVAQAHAQTPPQTETQIQTQTKPQVQVSPQTIQWRWLGDIRVREQSEKYAENEAQRSPKLRVRLGAAVAVSPSLRTEVRLATAKSHRSTNQSLGESKEPGAYRRFIGLDLAYIQWSPIFFAELYGGRIPQLHIRHGGSQILLDEDITLEGAGLSLTKEFFTSTNIFLNGGTALIKENYDGYYSQEEADNRFEWVQAGVANQFDKLKFTYGTGFFNFTSFKGKNFSDLVSGGDANGNSEDPVGVAKYDYQPQQYFLNLDIIAGENKFGLFSEYVVNTKVDRKNSALWTGVKFGHKIWEAQLAYGETKADAVPGLFTNSDFGGGTAGSQGTVTSLNCKFARNMALKITHFQNKVTTSLGDKSYVRTNVDVSASF